MSNRKLTLNRGPHGSLILRRSRIVRSREEKHARLGTSVRPAFGSSVSNHGTVKFPRDYRRPLRSTLRSSTRLDRYRDFILPDPTREIIKVSRVMCSALLPVSLGGYGAVFAIVETIAEEKWGTISTVERWVEGPYRVGAIFGFLRRFT